MREKCKFLYETPDLVEGLVEPCGNSRSAIKPQSTGNVENMFGMLAAKNLSKIILPSCTTNLDISASFLEV